MVVNVILLLGALGLLAWEIYKGFKLSRYESAIEDDETATPVEKLVADIHGVVRVVYVSGITLLVFALIGRF